eukprot:s2766_g6.t1
MSLNGGSSPSTFAVPVSGSDRRLAAKERAAAKYKSTDHRRVNAEMAAALEGGGAERKFAMREFVQLGLWAFSELGSGRELKDATAKSLDQRATQAVIAAGLDAAGTAAQELHGLSAKPAANLDNDNNEAAPPCPGEFWVGVVSLPVRGGRDSAWTSARGWASSSRVRGDTIVASRELGPVPEGETVRDNFDAPRVSDFFVSDRHIDIHVCEADVAGNPGASLPADSRSGRARVGRTPEVAQAAR